MSLQPPKNDTGPSCGGCPYRPTCVGYVPSQGPANARIMFVSEAPGRWEAELGWPFAGRAGGKLGELFHHAGIFRGDVLITNAVKCRCIVYESCETCRNGLVHEVIDDVLTSVDCPDCQSMGMIPYHQSNKDFKNAPPSEGQVRECRTRYLRAELEAFDGDLIVVMGDVALQAVTGAKGITRKRGTVQDVEIGGRLKRVFAAYHPAYLFRNRGAEPITLRDFSLIPEIAAGVEPPQIKMAPGYQRSIDLTFTLLHSPILAMDIETSSLDPDAGYIVCYGVSWAEGRSALLTQEQARQVLEEAHEITGHNFYGYDQWWLAKKGMPLPRKIWDSLLAAHVLNPERSVSHKLIDVQGQYAERPLKMSWKRAEDYATDKELVCLRDVDANYRARLGLERALYANGQQRLFDTLVTPLIPIAHDMRWRGIRIDRQAMDETREVLTVRAKQLEAQLETDTGITSAQSSKQVQKFLYETLGLSVKRNRKTGRPTADDDALLDFIEEADDPTPLELIREIRDLRKLSGAFLKQRLAADGRVHAEINIAGTATGRFSYSNPNLQQLPDSAKHICVPDDDHIFVSFDFKQIEFLLMLYQSHEWELLHAGLAGQDMHRMMASLMYRTPVERVSKEQRRRAKTCNFALIFGASEKSTARRERLPLEQVVDAYGRWYEAVPGLAGYRQAVADQVRRNGFIKTEFAWLRYLAADEATKAWNTPIQSDAAMVNRYALIRLAEALPKETRLVLTVHDQALIDTPPVLLGQVVECLRDVAMQPIPELPCSEVGQPQGLQFPIDISTGPNWRDMVAA